MTAKVSAGKTINKFRFFKRPVDFGSFPNQTISGNFSTSLTDSLDAKLVLRLNEVGIFNFPTKKSFFKVPC